MKSVTSRSTGVVAKAGAAYIALVTKGKPRGRRFLSNTGRKNWSLDHYLNHHCARGKMDYKRLNNNYFHVCAECDSKRFAQKKGVERKQVWNMSASSDIPIGKL